MIKRCAAALAASACIATAPAAMATPVALLENGSFEDGLAPWSVPFTNHLVVACDEAWASRTGNCSVYTLFLILNVRRGGVTDVQFSAGSYTFEAWYRIITQATDADFYAVDNRQVTIGAFSEQAFSGTRLSSEVVRITGADLSMDRPTPGLTDEELPNRSEWRSISTTFSVAEGNSTVVLVANSAFDPRGQLLAIAWDDFSLTQVPAVPLPASGWACWRGPYGGVARAEQPRDWAACLWPCAVQRPIFEATLEEAPDVPVPTQESRDGRA